MIRGSPLSPPRPPIDKVDEEAKTAQVSHTDLIAPPEVVRPSRIPLILLMRIKIRIRDYGFQIIARNGDILTETPDRPPIGRSGDFF